MVCSDKYLVKPIDVEIVNARHTLIVGREVELTCESRGSRPPAQLTWFKDNKELSHSRYSTIFSRRQNTIFFALK